MRPSRSIAAACSCDLCAAAFRCRRVSHAARAIPRGCRAARSWPSSPPGLRAVLSVPEREGSGLDEPELLAARDLVSRLDTELGQPTVDRRDDDVLHLHRLERDDRVAGFDLTADSHVDGQDRAGHRGDERGRPARDARAVAQRAAAPARSTSGGGGESERDAPAGDIDVDDVVDARRLANAARGVAERRPTGSCPRPRGGCAARRSIASHRTTGHRRVRGGRPRSQDTTGRGPGRVRDRRPLGPVVGRPDPIERVDAGCAVTDDGLPDQPAQEPQVRDEAKDDSLVERRRSAGQRFVTIGAPRDDLREHRVEPAADLGALARSRRRPGCRRRPASEGASTRPVAGRNPSSASSA